VLSTDELQMDAKVAEIMRMLTTMSTKLKIPLEAPPAPLLYSGHGPYSSETPLVEGIHEEGQGRAKLGSIVRKMTDANNLGKRRMPSRDGPNSGRGSGQASSGR